MTRLDEILSIRRRLHALKPNSRKRPPLEAKLVQLVLSQLRSERRQERKAA